MKNKITLISIIILVAFHFSSFGQLKTANRYFKLYRYAEAIPLYKKVVNKKSEEKRNEAIVRIADCYRYISNPLEAKSWYSQAIENPKTEAINYLYLGKALCELENYTDARKAFEKYHELVPDNPRGILYIDFCKWAIANQDVVANAVEIKNEKSLNTIWSDMCPVKYNDSIVITSDRVLKYKTTKEFQWTGNSYMDIYFSVPKYYKDYWTDMTAPKPLFDKLNHAYHNGPVVFSKDGNMIVISRTDRKKVKPGKDGIKTHKLKLFYAVIETGKKPKFLPFFLNDDEYSVSHATLSNDGKTMIFVSDKAGGEGEFDLYSCTWENGIWTNPKNLGSAINSLGNEVFPALVNDTILLFASDGHPGFGGLDLFVSYKRDTSWTVPKNMMKPINSSYDDFGILLFDNLKEGYFSSDRPEGVGLDDIYAFKNWDTTSVQEIAVNKTLDGPDINPSNVLGTDIKTNIIIDSSGCYISGYVKDRITMQPIDQATVFLYNPQTGKVRILKTGPDGYYKGKIERPADLLVKAMKSNYIADCLPWDIPKIEPGTKKASRDLLLDKLDLNRSFVLRNIYYDYDKYFIREDAKSELNKVIKILQDNPGVMAELSSHTDCRGSYEYNNALSQNRANAAVDYIVSFGGIMPGRLIAKGYGEYKLTNKCADGVPCTEAEQQANRRTEFKVVGFSQPTQMRGLFDPSKFAVGEVIDIKWLPENFFDPCNLTNEVPKQVQVIETPKQVIEAAKVDNKIPEKTTVTNTTPKTTTTPTTTTTTPKYHLVVSGETLNSISIKYSTTVQKLKDLNKLTSDKILAGQKLKLY
ncbi:MAG: OmpA family protein [Bacteroidota bacterium]